jgi:hypothetical protein
LNEPFKAVTLFFICILVNFLIDIVGGGGQLGPLGTAATRRPIVPTPGDYDMEKLMERLAGETEVLGENLSPKPLCPPQTLYAAAVGSQRLTA